MEQKTERFLNEALTLLIRRPIYGSLKWSLSGMASASILGTGRAMFQATLYTEAFFLLGPIGAARGFCSAAREMMIDRSMAANTPGCLIFKAARRMLEKQQRWKQDKEQPTTINLREAIQKLRTNYPLAESLVRGKGFLGAMSRHLLRFFLPRSAVVFDQMDVAIVWAEEQQTEDEGYEVVARATSCCLDAYIRQKEDLVTTFWLLLYVTLSGISVINY